MTPKRKTPYGSSHRDALPHGVFYAALAALLQLFEKFQLFAVGTDDKGNADG